MPAAILIIISSYAVNLHHIPWEYDKIPLHTQYNEEGLDSKILKLENHIDFNF